MKIWITRRSALQIQCGGLERLDVWFVKPRWVSEWRDEIDDDTPFGELSDMVGRKIEGWEAPLANSIGVSYPLSFGKIFGYSDSEEKGMNELAKYTWKRLSEHFKNENFDKWHVLEMQGISKKQDFLLELDIDIALKNM